MIDTLNSFGVSTRLVGVSRGPSVTRYEIQPSTGIKLAKITGLSEDIALNLAVPTVLVAAVPGKAAVGIEVPNNPVGTVTVRELMENNEFKNAKSKLTVALGKDIGGNVVIGDISKFPHVLIAGSTGSGKSVCINTIITSILYKANPDEVKLIITYEPYISSAGTVVQYSNISGYIGYRITKNTEFFFDGTLYPRLDNRYSLKIGVNTHF